MPPHIPERIARYQIERALGEGGMGSVYLAKDPAIDRYVAIKLLRSGFDDESARERFRREAKAVGQLHHINIVTIFDVGEHEGDPFIAMEYVQGQTLAQIVRSGAEIPLASALTWMDGLCAGLHYAHKRGIIHRDIKPANLVVDDESKVKILDFGIARGPSSGMTQVGMLMGTLNYMSPEQLSGKTIDSRSDIFAVGAVFYELLTGKQAFPGDINSGVLHKILMGQPDPISTLNPTIDEQVIAIISRCLTKEPGDRFTDLDVMRKELARVRARHDTFAPAATIQMPLPPSGGASARAGRTPGESTRAELMRQRRERIEQQLTRARAAIASRELGVAADACHQALILDPENSDAFELQEHVERMERAQQWLGEAKNELARGALTAAMTLMERVTEFDPDLPDAAPVRERIAAERERRAELERRAKALQDAIARGRAALKNDRLDLAAAAVEEAFALEKGHPDAAALARAIDARAAERKRAEELERAQETVAEAKRRFAGGEHDAAIAMLKGYRPAHAVVDEARQALEVERREILRRQEEERKRREEEARRQREEAERKRRAEEAERKRLAEEAERKRLAEEAERKRLAEEAERKRREDAERKAAAERARVEAERKAAELRAREEAERKAAAERARVEAEQKEAARKEAERKAAEDRARRDAEAKDAARREAEKKEAARKEAEQKHAERKAAEAEDTDKTIVMFRPVADAPKPAAPAPSAPTAPAPAKPVVAKPEPPKPAVPAPEPPKPVVAKPEPPPVAKPERPLPLVTKTTPPAPASTIQPASDLQPVERSSRAMLLGLAAVLVVAVALVVWWFVGRGGSVVTPVTASVLFDIRPWATLDTVTVKADGRTVEVQCPATPCLVTLPAGEYHVRASNPFFTTPFEFDVTVTADAYQEVRRTLPQLNAEEEARRILGER